MNGKTVMDALDAPQWTDFASSPQVSDDFFNRLHLEHELEYHEKLKQSGTSFDKYPADVSDFENVLDKVQITPIKVISPKNKNSKDEKLMAAKETTFGDLLLEAMSNLQFSTKKGRMNQSIANPSIDVLKTPKMPNKRITRSMSARMNSEGSASHEIRGEKDTQNIEDNVTVDDSEHSKLTKKLPSRIVTSFENQKISFNKKDKNQELDSCIVQSSVTKNNEQKLLKSQKNSDDNVSNEKKHMPSRIVTSFSSRKSSGSNKSVGAAPTKKRPYLLTSIRRQSLIKHKRNDPYVSLAEAVSKFQKGTPKRFRSVSVKDLKPGPVTSSKQVALKITRPVSPALTSKTRVRPIKSLSHEQKENTELEKIRSRPIRANRVSAVPALKNSELAQKIAKKPSSVPEPFYMTQKRKTCNFSSSESLSITQTRQTCHSSVSSLHDTLNPKKVVHTIVSTEDANLAVKEVELGHFGIPTEPCDKPKKFTRTLPFSFEIRNKEFREKKERKLKQIQLEEVNKIKMAEFHAKPAPSHVPKELSASKGKVTSKQNPKVLSSAKKTTPCPFSFEERNKLMIKKKEDIIKEALEKNKKAREFHANPVPEFRPVIVRGRSRENVRIEEKTPEKQYKINKALPVVKSCYFNKNNYFTKKNIDDQENNKPMNQRPKCKSDMNDAKSNLKINNNKKPTVLTELNTDKRARDRKEFHEKLKIKEMEEEALRRKEEEERLIREKAEKTELRRMAEIKARPMPQYKPLSIIKSNKPLTDPQSPAWVRKSKI